MPLYSLGHVSALFSDIVISVVSTHLLQDIAPCGDSHSDPTDRRIVVIELNSTRMSVVRLMPDGSSKRTERHLQTEAEARTVSEQFGRRAACAGVR